MLTKARTCFNGKINIIWNIHNAKSSGNLTMKKITKEKII
ncbi:hypothetical protein M527_12740 [Sphingobium indicum IP26]|nr:hypothetical protein M527_29095 [Sphingobium indicum IP26]EPR18354.1 hypothetical protein M527_12740 [Sphingobium indicum IP26]EQB03658.1 hypothetical protein L286_11570 [Sphingobium sp. HDIP04]